MLLLGCWLHRLSQAICGVNGHWLLVSVYFKFQHVFHLSMLLPLLNLLPFFYLLLTSTLHVSFLGLKTVMHTFCILQITRKQTNAMHGKLICKSLCAHSKRQPCRQKHQLSHGSCHFSSPLGLWFRTVSALVPSHLELDFSGKTRKLCQFFVTSFLVSGDATSAAQGIVRATLQPRRRTHGTVEHPTRK